MVMSRVPADRPSSRHNGQSSKVTALPLFVDLDGTLVRSNLLVESIVSIAKHDPLMLVLLPVRLLGGRAALKSFASRHGPVSVADLPYNEPLLEYLSEQKRAGRTLYLATAANRAIAERVAGHLGLFAQVIASEETINTKGSAKLSRILALQSGAPFAYAGDSAADRPLWDAASKCIFVDAPASDVASAKARGKVEKIFTSGGGTWRSAWKALRPHQWIKNALLFVPLLTAHLYTSAASVAAATLGFVIFSLCASAIYLINDMLDLQDDRTHPRKKSRPFASGALPITAGLALSPALLIAGFSLAWLYLPAAFTLTLAVYCSTSLLYSLWLKRVSTIDVFTLAGLYTIRVIAGSAAVSAPPTFWLLAFSMFLFLSLAFVKRYVELAQSLQRGLERLAGRGYAAVDLETTFTLGAVAGGLAVLVMALYLNSPEVRAQYPTPEFLWIMCPAILYWINRVWMGARRGKINEDPVLFAVKDRVSLATGAICLATIAAARLIHF